MFNGNADQLALNGLVRAFETILKSFLLQSELANAWHFQLLEQNIL